MTERSQLPFLLLGHLRRPEWFKFRSDSGCSSIVGTLIVLMAVVLLLTTIDLGWMLVQDILTPPVILLEIEELLEIFGFFLLILIGVELLETIKAYLNEGVVHVEVVLMVALIGDRPDIADAIRAQYRWFTVDEYQDITPVQDQLLSAWLGERDDVCVGGDASQTIYSFAGASPDALGQFARRWPNATEVRLDRCYRCTPEIVAAANAVIAGTGPESGPGTAVWLRSQRPSGVAPEVVACADDAEEAAAVAARINDLVASGYAHRDIAVLMRTNAASEPIEVAFAEADIPYIMRGAERFFDRPEVREAIVRMRGHAVAGRGKNRTANRRRSSKGDFGYVGMLDERRSALKTISGD
jgi:hypothetical protein